MRLESSMWLAAEELCRRESLTMDELCSGVARNGNESSLTSSMRVHVLEYFRAGFERLEASANGAQDFL